MIQNILFMLLGCLAASLGIFLAWITFNRKYGRPRWPDRPRREP